MEKYGEVTRGLRGRWKLCPAQSMRMVTRASGARHSPGQRD